jgi:hypothetical protein
MVPHVLLKALLLRMSVLFKMLGQICTCLFSICLRDRNRKCLPES